MQAVRISRTAVAIWEAELARRGGVVGVLRGGDGVVVAVSGVRRLRLKGGRGRALLRKVMLLGVLLMLGVLLVGRRAEGVRMVWLRRGVLSRVAVVGILRVASVVVLVVAGRSRRRGVVLELLLRGELLLLLRCTALLPI